MIRIDQTDCSLLLEFLPKMKSNQMDTISILTEVTGSGKFSTTIPHFFYKSVFYLTVVCPLEKSDALNVC